MIAAIHNDAEEDDFLILLTRAKDLIWKKLCPENKLTQIPDDDEFEELVYQNIKTAAEGTKFHKVIRTKSGEFPDIVADDYFGVEVKMTKGDKWQSFGNSILESTRVEVKKIFVFFGKFGRNALDMRIKRYSEAISSIKVTHYPRYMINMDLAPNENIFSKMGLEYEVVRTSPIKHFKNYYRKNLNPGEEPWWLDSAEETTDPILRLFSALQPEKQDDFRAEAMTLFPEIFGNGRSKFNRAGMYLTSKVKVISNNFRDIFTASGQVDLTINDHTIKVPKILGVLHRLYPKILSKIEQFDEETLKHYWDVDKIESNRISQWKRIVDEYGKKIIKNRTISSILT